MIGSGVKESMKISLCQLGQ
ncbi:hypothetical protein Goarm_002413 [Gossypium armourianum]|uniref:Uncharacterized protein n=1 Tax=Gossypium armourianum TaxID=34283 RepID=A0A7J9K800_9ROSI|nr:hypothetical protein [Gossypium armourianum]